MDAPHNLNLPIGKENESLKEAITKTASYVKEHGTIIEEKLKNDDNFSFINPEHEYYEYYQYIKDHVTPQPSVPKEPYSFSFMSYDKNISLKDLEIIKTTAAFCVANEKTNYLDELKKEFDEDSQLSFLKAEHPLNSIFVQFINQYKQIKNNALGPPLFNYENSDYKSTILRRSFQRAEYYEYSKEAENQKKQLTFLRKVQFAAFDWTNFNLVGKAYLKDTDKVPLDFAELSLKKIDKTSRLDFFDEKDSNNNNERKGKKRKLRAAGETRLKKKKIETEVREIECPITHKMIPEDRFDRHLQILLGDPDYSAEREKFKAQHKISNLSSDGVFENIKRLAKNTAG
ncbi:uncharacterized protein ZBIST_3769 [Zygosaccharomyces bailii]|nr:uncharacterized protein ZBIST_3769 [Zygosaccharomyces bailii]